MGNFVNFHFDIDGDNFTSAGEASVRIKKSLREMGFTPMLSGEYQLLCTRAR